MGFGHNLPFKCLPYQLFKSISVVLIWIIYLEMCDSHRSINSLNVTKLIIYLRHFSLISSTTVAIAVLLLCITSNCFSLVTVYANVCNHSLFANCTVCKKAMITNVCIKGHSVSNQKTTRCAVKTKNLKFSQNLV